MSFIKRNKLLLVGIVLGGIIGSLYYNFWGCQSGCHIRSSPLMMTSYGGVMGGLLLSTFKKT